MPTESEHVAVHIDRPQAEVYDYVRDPARLPAWAAGLGSSVAQVDGQWIAETSAGRVCIAFAADNDLGVVDHDLTLPDGRELRVYMRVLADDPGSEVVFTVRRLPAMTDDDFARDIAAVEADLATLKAVLEAR